MTLPELLTIEKIKVDDTASCELTITEQHIQQFVDLSQDDNPLHVDESTAKLLGFEGRVAHGMLSLNMISRLIGTQLPGAGSLWMSQDTQFAAPVYVGSRLRATVIVTGVSHAAGVVSLRTLVENEDRDEVVLRGTAKVRIPSPAQSENRQ